MTHEIVDPLDIELGEGAVLPPVGLLVRTVATRRGAGGLVRFVGGPFDGEERFVGALVTTVLLPLLRDADHPNLRYAEYARGKHVYRLHDGVFEYAGHAAPQTDDETPKLIVPGA